MGKDILYPLRRLHGRFHMYAEERKEISSLCSKIKNLDLNTSLYILTPTHGNLGDHAIAQASIELFQKNSINFFEISDRELYLLQKYNRLNIMDKRVILVHGGGFLGTLWFNAELLLRAIIINNPNSKIIVMPNTIYYEDNDYGRRELDKSLEIYNAHPSLTIYAREQLSYDFMKPLYNDVRLVPDMVLSMNQSTISSKRNGCLLCLRNDIERTRSDEDEKTVIDQVKELFGNRVTYTDMAQPYKINSNQRRIELEKKYSMFRNSELVITDRLHGMIFSAITGTPCIVINSKSPKVMGCYDWISNLPYIKVIDKPSQVAETFIKMEKTNCIYSNEQLLHYYKELFDFISDVHYKG